MARSIALKKVPFVRALSHGSREPDPGESTLSLQSQKPPAAFPVQIQEHLRVPSLWKVYSVIVVNVVAATFLAIIPFRPVWIHKDGGMSSGLHTAWVFSTTALATIIKMWTTGVIQTMWAHIAIKPQASPQAAALRARFARSMLGIGSFRDVSRHPQVIGFLFVMGIMLASISAAIAPTDVKVTLRSQSNTSAMSTSSCFRALNATEASNVWSWNLNNGSYMTNLDTQDPKQAYCPWTYAPTMVKPGLYPKHEGAYAVSGVLVNNDAIGVPVSIPGGYDEIFGIAGNIKKAPDQYYTGPQIHKAKACLPRLARNPISCRVVSQVVTWEPYNRIKYSSIRWQDLKWRPTPDTNDTYYGEAAYMYCMKTSSACGKCIVPEQNVSTYWAMSLGSNTTSGRATFCLGEARNNVLPKLMGQQSDSPSNRTAVECTVDLEPTIDTRTTLAYWNKQYEKGSPEPESTFPWQVSAASPAEPCQIAGNGTAFRSAEALSAGLAGAWTLVFERMGQTNMFWPTLWQVATDIQGKSASRGYNFANSQNAFEDALGIAIGASIGTYWGSVINKAAPAIDTTYDVDWVVLGPRQPWALLFAIPSALCAAIALVLHLKMDRAGRAGYYHLPG